MIQEEIVKVLDYCDLKEIYICSSSTQLLKPLEFPVMTAINYSLLCFGGGKSLSQAPHSRSVEPKSRYKDKEPAL